MRLLVATTIMLLLSSCALQPLDHQDLAQMGSTHIVYVDMPSNLAVNTRNYTDNALEGGIWLFVSMPASAAVYLTKTLREHHAESRIESYESTINSLPFKKDFFQKTNTSIQSSPWASKVPFSTIKYQNDSIENAEQALQAGHTNSVVFIWPGVFLDDSGKQLIITMHTVVYVAAKDRESGRLIPVKYKVKDFTYTYSIKFNNKNETWAQQKQDAERIAGMSLSDFLGYWMTDNAAQVRADFGDALPKIESDLRRYFSAPSVGQS